MKEFSLVAYQWRAAMTSTDITGHDGWLDGKTDFYDLLEISLSWLNYDGLK